MSNKITAHFGADVSEVEAKMLQATRATKSYERAVNGLSKSDAGSGLARNMSKVDGVLGDITKKFGAGKIFESVLGGVGLGSGFAIAQKGAELISGYWQKAAESAERIAAASSESTDYVLKRIGLRETDEQKLIKARRVAENANQAVSADSGRDPERTAELVRDANKAQYELDVLEKKAREKKADEDKKADEEARKRFERDLDWQMQSSERMRQEEKMRADDAAKSERDRQDAIKETNKVMAEAGEIGISDQEKLVELLDREKVISQHLEGKAKGTKEHAETVLDLERTRLDIAKLRAKLNEEEQKQLQEIEQLEYDRTWRFASDAQRMAQVIKEGREAQARYDKEKSTESLLALEKLRKKWLDLRDEINKANDEAKASADAPIINNGAKVSAEDRARANATRERNEVLNREAQRGKIRDSGRIGNDGKPTMAKTENLLESINKKLDPESIK